MTTTTVRSARSTRSTLPRRLAVGAVAKTLRLSATTTSYTISRVAIPMRDRVELIADVYEPTSPAVGTLLARGPYGRGFPFGLVFADLHAARGYRVVLQSVRGTFGSGGEFDPMRREADDGADTVEWMRQQPWFDGRFATVGISYLGFTQFALLTNPPPELVTSVIVAGPHDMGMSAWGTGAFSVHDLLGWSNMVAHQEDGGQLRAGVHQLTAPAKVARTLGQTPLGEAGRALLGSAAPWWESWLVPPTEDATMWDAISAEPALDHITTPLLLISGWQDLFLPQTVHQFRYLRERGVDVALTMGPWTHTQLLVTGLATVMRETQNWLDTHLARRPVAPRSARCRIYVNHEGWRDLPTWPPATAPYDLFLRPGGGLADAPPATGSSASFRYHPADPTPTIGGRLLSREGGYRDDSALTRRPDVLSFTSDVLTDDVVVQGNPIAELAHTADHPYVDVFVRLSEVDAKDRSSNVSDGFTRLSAAADHIRLELDAVAHRFRAGTRIRVLIAGGSHPRYDRNLGGGESTATGSQLTPATHEVHLGKSRIVLPVQR